MCWQYDDWDMFRQHFMDEGFLPYAVSGYLKEGDVLLMQIQGANPNHIAVVVDPEKEIMLHQRIGKRSDLVHWTGYYRENTVNILRLANA
jgi:hypothetical protein